MNTPHPPDGEHVWSRYALLVAFVAGLGFFALSFLLLGIIPGRSLATLVREQAPADMAPYTASEERGRQIYAAEGCGYCHSQQVPFVPADVARWGAPTEAWETKFDAPRISLAFRRQRCQAEPECPGRGRLPPIARPRAGHLRLRRR